MTLCVEDEMHNVKDRQAIAIDIVMSEGKAYCSIKDIVKIADGAFTGATLVAIR